MKKFILLLFAIICIVSNNLTAQVSVNTDGSGPDGSAMLEVKSSDKGMLIPRMTAAEIAGIANQANGLIAYNTDDSRFYFYDGSAGEWKEMSIASGTITPSLPVEVYNPTTGETWMDRNLGASRRAINSGDNLAYGDLYQWGRATEGHESRSSGSINPLATTPVPNDGNQWDGYFIKGNSNPYDWLATQDNILWQGLAGTNNPCPSGFRLPTEAEWDAERQSWASNNAAGAFGSPLKITRGGLRSRTDGSVYQLSNGRYWSSTVSGSDASVLSYDDASASMTDRNRAFGYSIRCIKD